jgi:hypothetical protein
MGTLAALAVLTACEGQRTTENDPLGVPSFNFRLTGVSRGLPRTAGTDALFLTLGTFDTTLADGFGRQGDLTVRLRGATNWNLVSTVRRLSVDGRAPTLKVPLQVPLPPIPPALVAFPQLAQAATLTLEGPEAAAGLWRLNMTFLGLDASTGYTVALVRYGLKTSSTATDSLDQTAALLTGSNFTVPDSLFVLGGVGSSASLTGGCTGVAAATSSATANPLIIGTFTSTALGESAARNAANAVPAITRCINDAAGLYYRASDIINANKTPIAPNTGRTFGLGQYNYIVVYQTSLGLIAGTVLRGQFGQDLNNTTGNPINNAFAPFPCRTRTAATTDPASAFINCTASNVLSTRGKIDGPGGDAAVDSARLSIRGLKALSGTGVYQAWLVNPAATPAVAPVPALGRLVVSQLDTVTDVPVLVTNRTVLDSTTTNVSTFVGYPMPQAAHVTWQFRPTSAASGVSMANYTHVLITLESAPGATTPSANTALWYAYADQKGTATLRDDNYLDATATVVWGRLDLANLATRVFAQAGSGFGGIRGDEVSVDFTSLARPPVGYYYQAWLQDVNGPDTLETATGDYIVGKDTFYLAVDTLRAPFPGRALLFDADASIPDPVVQDVPPMISAANIRTFAGNIGLDLTRLCVVTNPARGFCPFGRFDNYLVTLEPKGSSPTSPSPTIVFTSSLPGLAKTGR